MAKYRKQIADFLNKIMPEISIRTMASDIAAMERGGGAPVFNAGSGSGEINAAQAGNISENNLFQSSLSNEALPSQNSSQISFDKTNLIIIIGGIFLLGLAAGLTGYFAVFPWLFR